MTSTQKQQLEEIPYGDKAEEEHYHDSDGDEIFEEKHKRIIDETKKMGDEITNAFIRRTSLGSTTDVITDSDGHVVKKRRKSSRIAAQARSDSAHDHCLECQKEGSIHHAPTPSMTGVDKRITRLCAAVSGQIYFSKSRADFKLSNKHFGLDNVEIIKFDTHGKLAETTPPFVAVVFEKTMICGWRGSSTLMDWVVDFAFAPVASSRWIKSAKSVRCQGGYCALVENELSLHEDFLMDEIKKRGIKDLIFTGHSLAGGVAQVAHLFVEGSRANPRSPWSESTLKDLNVRTIAFSAPMTTVNLDRKHDPESVRFVNHVGSTMCNVIYESDPVPRGYAHLDFIHRIVRNALPQVVKGLKIPRTVKWAFGVQGRIQDAITDGIEGNQELFRVAESFRHIGKVIYYEDEQSEPVTYCDKGFHYSKPKDSTQNLFYDIEYKESDNVFQTAADNHNFLVRGPGLAYGVEQPEAKN